MSQPLLFDIKRYAINDGPGIRVTIFLKGCPLSCEWCHNPESQSLKVQKMYTNSKCIACGECVKACEQNACTLSPNGIITDPKACILCGKCAEVCPTKATEMSGELQTVDQIMAAIDKEMVFFDQSGGGVTFSGGEPLMHADFLLQLLEECGKKNIHRVVDTSGFTKKETLLKVADKTEHFLFDLKMMDSAKHKKYTGVPNTIILDNLTLLSKIGTSITIRIPLIEGVNDDAKNIDETINFLLELPGDNHEINLLPYHGIAAKKYEKLGAIYHEGSMAEPSEEKQMRILEKFKLKGLNASIGG